MGDRAPNGAYRRAPRVWLARRKVCGYCRARQRRLMPNPQLDQFTSALWWKLVPWLILGGGGGMLAALFLKWLERRAAEIGRKRRELRNKAKAPRRRE